MTALSEHVDLMSLMQVYDFRTYSGEAALSILQNSTNEMRLFDDLIEMGVPAQKLVMGIQFLAHKFKHTTHGIEFEETMGLSHACEMQRKFRVADLLRKKNPPKNSITYFTVEFESSVSIEMKMEFVESRHLAGCMIFPINTDDFLEKCEETYSVKSTFVDFESDYHVANPFLRCVNDAIAVATKNNSD